MELNMFADLSIEEFREYLGTKPAKELDTVMPDNIVYLNVSDIPKRKNFFAEGAVTPVKA